MKTTTIITLIITAALPLLAQEKKKNTPSEKNTTQTVTKKDTLTIDGKKIPYQVTASNINLKTDNGEPRANIFHVTYKRTDIKDTSKRPVLFAFNGGPGSSAVWLHLGTLGPKILATSPDGTTALAPPITVTPNPQSILDVADLVFIDPVSTGYSKTDGDAKKSEFHGVQEDINSMADFIRRWVSEHKRWHSPKFILGESYGGVRSAGLARRLQSRYGMNLNGVIMLSSLLDYRTLRGDQGDDLTYSIFLPTFTATAHHHGMIEGDRQKLVQLSRQYAFGPYATLLLKGSTADPAELNEAAKTLAELTGIAASTWLENNLRLSPSRFRKELLRSQNKVLGRFDARVAWPAANKSSDFATYDPSYSVIQGAFSTAMLDYLTRDLGWETTQPYEILTSKVHPWNWGTTQGYVNVSQDIASAMRDNPKLKLLVLCGYTDLATPPDGIIYTLNHLHQIPAESRKKIQYAWYDGGHMFYLNQPDLIKLRQDLVNFITNQ